jgi:hypothetical protein
MKYKYLIPVLIGVILVSMITPAFATRTTLGETQSKVSAYNAISWYGSFTDPQDISVSSGDDFQWHNYCYMGDTQYTGTHTVSVQDQVDGYWENPYNLGYTQRLTYNLVYGQSMDETAQSMDYIWGNAGTFDRYHKSVYNGDIQFTSYKTVRIL